MGKTNKNNKQKVVNAFDQIPQPDAADPVVQEDATNQNADVEKAAADEAVVEAEVVEVFLKPQEIL